MSILYFSGTVILLTVIYLYHKYFIKPQKTLQFYKNQGLETFFYPVNSPEYQGGKNLVNKIALQKATQEPKPKAWAANIGDTTTLFLKDPELIKNFYLYHDQFYEKLAASSVFFKKFAGDGVLMSEGSVWKRHRKLASAAFNYEFLKQMIPEVAMIGNERLEKLKVRSDLSKVDILNEIQLITGEIGGRIFFGESFSNYEYAGKPITQGLTDLLIESAFEDYHPLSLLLPKQISLRGIVPRHKRALNRIEDFRSAISKIANQNMAKTAEDVKNNSRDKKRVNLMELFHKQRVDNPEEAFTDEDLVDEFITFFLAGTDTTGHTLVMATYYLLKNPQCRAKVFEEVDRLFANNNDISIETLNKMDYVTAFLKETLRMSPISGSLFSRVAIEDHELANLTIKKGTAVNVPFLSNYYDPDYHAEPEKFIPERWLDENSKTRKSVAENAFVYLPFSAGSRNCLGQHLAMNEARVIFSLFLKKFNYALSDPKYELQMVERFLYEPVSPIFYSLQPKP